MHLQKFDCLSAGKHRRCPDQQRRAGSHDGARVEISQAYRRQTTAVIGGKHENIGHVTFVPELRYHLLANVSVMVMGQHGMAGNVGQWRQAVVSAVACPGRRQRSVAWRQRAIAGIRESRMHSVHVGGSPVAVW